MTKNLPANAGDVGLLPEAGRSPGEGNGSPLQYSCLGNPMNRGAWQARVHRVTKESVVTSYKQQDWDLKTTHSVILLNQIGLK